MFGVGLGVRSQARTFSPLQISGLACWLDANVGVTLNGSKVAAWADQSGTGDSNKNVSQANDVWRPTFTASNSSYNKQPSIDFSAINSTRLFSGPWASPLPMPETIFVVGNFSGGAGNEYMTDGYTDNERVVFNNIGTSGGAIYNGTVLDSATPLNANPRVIAGQFNGASSKVWISALTPQASGNASSLAANRTGLTVGDFHGTTAAYLTGSITEIIIYSKILSTTEFAAVMQYLGRRYAIAIGA